MSAALALVPPSAIDGQDQAADLAALLAELGELAVRLTEVTVQRDELRALVLDMADHEADNERWRKTCTEIGHDRYEAGRRDEAEAAWRRSWGGWPT